MTKGQLSVLEEQAEIDRASRRMKEERLCRAARLDPDLSIAMLAERFDIPIGSISLILRRAGIKLERDDFGADWNREHRRKPRRERTA